MVYSFNLVHLCLCRVFYNFLYAACYFTNVIYYISKTLDSAQRNYTTTVKDMLPVVFVSERFRPYLMCSKAIFYNDHTTLKYLTSKRDAKPKLIRWMLLLQEFDYKVLDKSGKENLVADHLSRLPLECYHGDSGLIDDSLRKETLYTTEIKAAAWFADMANYLACGIVLEGRNSRKRRIFYEEAKYYYWHDPLLFRFSPDGIYRRCITEDEVASVIDNCHSLPCRGHARVMKTVAKIHKAGFF